MAIQPIDLQTLYTQLEKVGKTQIQQQVAAQALRDAEQAANRKDAEHKLKSVQDPDWGDEQTGVVHEKNGSGSSESGAGGTGGGAKSGVHDEKAETEGQAEPDKEVIHDPALGKHIDISG